MATTNIASSTPESSKVRRLADVRDVTDLKSSRYDAVASWLIALLMLIGVVVGTLLLIWLSSQITVAPPPVEVLMEDLGGGGGREDGIPGEVLDFDSPNAEVIAGESELTDTPIEQTLTQITDAVSSMSVSLPELVAFDETVPGEGGRSEGDSRRPGLGTGGGTGNGDGIGWGSGSGPGGGGRSRAERWEIYYQDGGTIEEYARQLDFFKVELGVVGGTGEVQYAFHLTQPKPDTRNAPGKEEKRLYMSWRQGSLQQADRELLTRAGINYAGRIVVQFYSPETENMLAHIEKNFRNLEASRIRKTRFGVRPTGGGFEYYVIDQTAF